MTCFLLMDSSLSADTCSHRPQTCCRWGLSQVTDLGYLVHVAVLLQNAALRPIPASALIMPDDQQGQATCMCVQLSLMKFPRWSQLLPHRSLQQRPGQD